MVTVERFGVLWCPHWPVVAAVGDTAEPVVVLHANRVVAHSAAAGADGIVVGMRRRQAQSHCPHVQVVAHDPDRDARRFDDVARAVGESIPRLDIVEPGLVAFAARGPARYFGGEPVMLDRMVAVAAGAAGHPVAGAIADGRFAATVAAHRAARTGAAVVVPAGGSAAFLAELPVSLLATVAGLAPELVELFHRLGVRRLGQVAALPPTELLARFGTVGVTAHRLAGGGDDRPPSTVDPPPGWQVQRVLDEPVHQLDTLVFIGRQAATELGDTLAADGSVCTRLAVIAETEHGERSERVWYRSTGLSVAAMVERIRWQLDAWVQRGDLSAGVVLVRLEPIELVADDGQQLGLWGGRTEADEWAARAIARLATLAGEQQVLVPAAAGGRQPGDAFTWVPAVTADLADASARLAPSPGVWPGQLPSPSPATVHRTPVALTVLDDTGTPVRVGGRGQLSAAPSQVVFAPGDADTIVAWAGPWPVEERWWDPVRARRLARFQLQLASGRVVLAGIERQRWWLQAEYD